MLLRGRKGNTAREEHTGVCVIFYWVVFILLLFFKLQMFVIRTLLYEYSQNGTNFFFKSRPEIRTVRTCWVTVSHVSPDCLTGCLVELEDSPEKCKGYSVSSESRPSAAASSWPVPPPGRGGRAGSPSAPRPATRHRSASGAGWRGGIARPPLQQRKELQCCPLKAGQQAGGISKTSWNPPLAGSRDSRQLLPRER